MPTSLELDQREIFLAHVAQRTTPGGGDIGETGARREPFLGDAVFFVVDPAANQADPAFVFQNFTHDRLFYLVSQNATNGATGAEWCSEPGILPEP